ncbi:hypothetical protein CCP3SC5AM1_1750002 [Gammaproteobacteria bacterium]
MIDFPDDSIILSKLFQRNSFCSWVTLRGYVELLLEKGLITITEQGKKKTVH